MRRLIGAGVVLVGLGGCLGLAPPGRFGSPMLTEPFPDAPVTRAPASTTRTDAAIRVVSAPTIHEASAAAADAVTREAAARGVVLSRLPSPHRTPEAAGSALRTPDALRGRVGHRDKRDPIVVALGWSRELGATLATTADTSAALLAWAATNRRIAPRTDTPALGDLLVFDHATSDQPADLVAIVIARDARGVIEFGYLANGVVRHGFLDASRPTLRRDASGDVVNTFLRHGRRMPPRGTRYLAGELLAHVIRVR